MRSIFITEDELHIKGHRKSKSDRSNRPPQTSKDITLPPVSTIDNSIQLSIQNSLEQSSLNNPLGELLTPRLKHYSIREGNKRLSELEGRSRLIQNYYKRNLKEAFEEKIKTYRLQSYLQRKDEQQSLLVELERRQQDLLEEKSRKVKEIRLGRQQSREVAQSQLMDRSERARLQSRAAREVHYPVMQEGERTRTYRLNVQRQINNRTHDQIRNQAQSDRQKRQLLHQLAEMRRKELHALQVKRQLEQIIEKEDYLASLKEQLLGLPPQQQRLEEA